MLGKEEIVSPALDELKEHYQRIITLLGEDAGTGRSNLCQIRG